MVTARSGFVLSAILTVSLAAAQGPHKPVARGDLPPVVSKMISALGKLRYSGTRVVDFRIDGERVRNVEIMLVDGRRSRTEFAGGSAWEGQVIVENENGRQHYFPDKNEIHNGPRGRDEASSRLRMLFNGNKNKFSWRISDGGTIAGRRTTGVAVADPAGNIVTRLWIDNDTGLALKRELYDRVGSLMGSFEFTKINFRPRFSPNDFLIQRKGATVVDLSDTLRKISTKMGLPAMHLKQESGASLTMVRPVGGPDAQVIMSVYSVGDRRVSLFCMRKEVDQNRLRKQAGPALGVYRWKQGDVTLVLMGDAPTDKLKSLAEFVTP